MGHLHVPRHTAKEIECFQRVIQRAGYTAEDVSALTGLSHGTISNLCNWTSKSERGFISRVMKRVIEFNQAHPEAGKEDRSKPLPDTGLSFEERLARAAEEAPPPQAVKHSSHVADLHDEVERLKAENNRLWMLVERVTAA